MTMNRALQQTRLYGPILVSNLYRIAFPEVVAEISKMPAALATFTWLEDAMLPLPESASVPALIVVVPV